MSKTQFDKTLIIQEIREFLKQLDWPQDNLSSEIIRTFYQGDYGVSQVLIKIQEDDMCMLIDPLIDKNNKQWGESVINLISAMGQEIKHVDIGIDQDGDIFAKVNLTLSHINLERFQCLLLGLCQVAENILVPILQANAFDNLRVHSSL